jgi:hypothetical protein
VLILALPHREKDMNQQNHEFGGLQSSIAQSDVSRLGDPPGSQSDGNVAASSSVGQQAAGDERFPQHARRTTREAVKERLSIPPGRQVQ